MNRDSDKYHLLIENLPDAFAYHQIVTDGDGEPVDYIFLEVNAAFEEMTGLKREKMIGKNVTEVLPGIENSEFDWIGTYGRVAQGGEPVRFESFSGPLGRWYDVRAYSDKPGCFTTVFRDITERKKNEELLKMHNVILKTQQELSLDGVIVVDENDKVISFNQKFSDIWGIPDEIMASQSREKALNYVLPKLNDPEEFTRRIGELYNNRQEKSHEEISLKDGKLLDRYSAPMFSDKGQYYGRVWYYRDITERKQAEEALRKSEAFSRAVMDHLPIGLAVNFVDPEVNFTYMNDNFSKMYHTTREALFDQDAFWDVVYEDHQFRSEIKQRVIKDCASGNPEKMMWEDIPITRSGKIVAHISASNIPVPENDLMISTVWDVTKRVKTEQTLQESETRFQRMLNVIPDMVSIHDPDMNIVYSNWKGFAAVSPEKQVLNTKCYKTYRGYDQICPDCQAVQVLKSKEAFQAEVELSEDYWIDLRVIPIFDNSGKVEYFVEWLRDISGFKVIEEELKELNINLENKVEQRTARLEMANRELDAFTHSASHDLRGPLNRISGFSEALLEDHSGQLDPQGLDYLKRINNSSENMKLLIDDLLKLSRVSQSQISRETVELSALATVYLKELQAREPHQQVEAVIAPGLIVEADTTLMRIALENLLDNAWKFTAGEDTPRIEFGSIKQDRKIVYYLKDNGTGFEMKHAEKLFAPFQRLHDAKTYPGTGIGLSIVSRIIHRHGGEIWAEGEVGKGACFFFTLP